MKRDDISPQHLCQLLPSAYDCLAVFWAWCWASCTPHRGWLCTCHWYCFYCRSVEWLWLLSLAIRHILILNVVNLTLAFMQIWGVVPPVWSARSAVRPGPCVASLVWLLDCASRTKTMMLPMSSFTTLFACSAVCRAPVSRLTFVWISSSTVLILTAKLIYNIHLSGMSDLLPSSACNTSFMGTAYVENILQFQLVIFAKQFFLCLSILDTLNQYLLWCVPQE